jgi:hypothetical protein
MAGVEEGDDVFYFVIPLRNVGSGLAVLHGWQVREGPFPTTMLVDDPEAATTRARLISRPDPEDFRIQQIDLYIPAGDIGTWLGAVRDLHDQARGFLSDSLRTGERIMIDLLYGDHEGGQRTISRFGVTQGDDGRWGCNVVRHWSVEGADPR